MGQLIGVLRGVLQRTAPHGGLFSTQPQFNPSLERGQRRSQFMGGIGNKLRLALKQITQAFIELVQRIDQRAQLTRHAEL